RPIFAIVISILIVLGGAIAGFNLPIAQYPQIQPPTVSVETTYLGANAGAVNQSVAQIIEEQVNGVQGMDYMSSMSDDAGRYSLSVVFDLGIDGDIASVKVQNNVAQANASLPAEVREYGVVTKKASSDMALVASFYSPQGTHDDTFLSNYVKVYVLDAIKRVNGVGDVMVFGSDLARRIWINPDRLAELNLTIGDVVAAVQDQNTQAAAGTIGGMPVDRKQETQYTGHARGRLESIEEFGNIIVRANPNGSFIFLKDLARIENAGRILTFDSKLNGRNALGLAVQLTSDANALKTIGEVKETLARAAADLPPDVAYTTVVDNTEYIASSLEEVAMTFLEALLLVIVIVFIFLQSWRATLIPILAVPVSLIGAFAAFVVLGFTINTLTLFAMVLAIGLVVDDAIVVIEAVEHHMRASKLNPREATRRAMAEVSGPVVAIAFVLSSVFIPVAFLGGMLGVLYRQFALTIAISVGLSAFIALSLTPALCASLLKAHDGPAAGGLFGGFFNKFNAWFERTIESYGQTVQKLIRRARYVVIFLLLIFAFTGVLAKTVRSTFIPEEDQAFVITSVTLPDGASMNRTMDFMDRFGGEVQTIPGVKNVMAISGFDIISDGVKSSAGTMFVSLNDWSLRKGAATQINAIVARIMEKSRDYPEASIIAMNPPSLPGLGMVGGFTMVLQDISGHSDEEMAAAVNRLLLAANTKAGAVTGVYTPYSANAPAIEFAVDREKAKTLGVSLKDVFDAMQVNFGGTEINDFNLFGRTYKVSLQADVFYRNETDALRFIYVRSATGAMIPLNTLVTPKVTTSPPNISRFNALRSIPINGSVAPGYSSGQAIEAMEALAAAELPDGFAVEWSGQSREEKKAGNTASQIMALALVFVFLCLAALYESWSVPYAVLLSVPTAVFGAFLSQYIVDLENSVYMQIGIITLIGLAAKNAILIVEFAKVRVDEGMPPAQAAIEAAKLRLRPILMTSLAFIIGCIPLAVASGAGAGARNAMGTAVVGGMTIATSLGIFIIPVLFVVVEWVTEKFGFRRRKTGDAAQYPPQAG
ncbi:MAG: multidrug efflux RND transporter permease subunit, partial [Acidaminococcales bacterium]|nr:multidrug efflux RND transporter permease subunit [Acidaminococcales bacterium]